MNNQKIKKIPYMRARTHTHKMLLSVTLSEKSRNIFKVTAKKIRATIQQVF